MIEGKCPNCGKIRSNKPSRANRVCRSCSISKSNSSKTESRNPRWLGGVLTDRKGYTVVATPPELRDRYGHYILEHRLVMEKILGRPLRKTESVHHRNGIKKDNRPENLELWVKTHLNGQRVDDLIDFVVKNYRNEIIQKLDL